MVKRSLTSSIIIKKKNNKISDKKSPISKEYEDYLNNDKEKKRKEMNELIDKIEKHKLDKLINKRIDGEDINKKYKKIKENPEIYFTIDELNGLIDSKKIKIDRISPKKEDSKKLIYPKKKNKFTRKKSSMIKDINEIEINIEKDKNIKHQIIKKMKEKLKKETPKKETPKKENFKKPIRRTNKKKNRSNKSVKKINVNNISEKEIYIIDKHIKSIRSKNPDEIKKELEKNGIKVSGKSNRLLKDIYLYSKICDINIKHE